MGLAESLSLEQFCEPNEKIEWTHSLPDNWSIYGRTSPRIDYARIAEIQKIQDDTKRVAITALECLVAANQASSIKHINQTLCQLYTRRGKPDYYQNIDRLIGQVDLRVALYERLTALAGVAITLSENPLLLRDLRQETTPKSTDVQHSLAKPKPTSLSALRTLSGEGNSKIHVGRITSTQAEVCIRLMMLCEDANRKAVLKSV